MYLGASLDIFTVGPILISSFINQDLYLSRPHKIKKKYIESMDEKEQIAYNIAKEHLESSFNLEKSIGFQKWLKKNSNNI